MGLKGPPFIYIQLSDRGQEDGKGMLYCVYSLCRIRLFVTLWTVAHHAPLSMGILHARILEWVAMPSSRGSSQPMDQTHVSCISGRFFTSWATK